MCGSHDRRGDGRRRRAWLPWVEGGATHNCDGGAFNEPIFFITCLGFDFRPELQPQAQMVHLTVPEQHGTPMLLMFALATTLPLH
eukprot:COSAG02_NODE_99_length_37069_cov_24.910957_32_plen_85_part_00